MDFRQKYSLDAMRRAQGFLDTNTAVLGTVNSSGARAELDDAVAQPQRPSRQSRREQSCGARHDLAAWARSATRFDRRTCDRSRRSRRRALSTVPQFSALQAPRSEDRQSGAADLRGRGDGDGGGSSIRSTFTGLGLPPDFLTQLQAAVNAVQGAVDQHSRPITRYRGSAPRPGRARRSRRGRHAIDLLDSLVVPLLANNAQLLASWRNAKRVVNKPGVAAKGSTPTPAPTPTPTPTPVPTPIVGPTEFDHSPIPADVPAQTTSPVSAVTQAA